MPATVVVGTQWGDEGKGKLTDLLARDMDMVVRYQGGHNAGHRIVVDGEAFALQLVPSGVLYSHITPVIGNGVVVDPAVLLSELDTLGAQRIEFSEQDGGVYDNAVADHRRDVRVEHARRDELEGKSLPQDNDSVSGVMATLVADHHIHVTSQEIGEFPFSFVTPLGTDHYGCGHLTPSRRPRCLKSLPHQNNVPSYWNVRTPSA